MALIALTWWYKLGFEDQYYKVIEFLKGQLRDTTEVRPDNLSVDEVKEIYQLNHRS